ncbi:hypothetical protein [Ciceribacter sp. L1K22]|uniref:hypothetical protein n=1 Tax=Ciceribacter sp. L1K22 TaxID=2820275 RepID=UPI001ABE5F4D|nr:hypothetical protein [Ciceribacter sp. L1K22]MBO3759581.1 hypothetical protein [Ciceribacter sp. L1K22]
MGKIARRLTILTLTMTIFAFTVSALVNRETRGLSAAVHCPLTSSLSCLAAL